VFGKVQYFVDTTAVDAAGTAGYVIMHYDVDFLIPQAEQSVNSTSLPDELRLNIDTIFASPVPSATNSYGGSATWPQGGVLAISDVAGNEYQLKPGTIVTGIIKQLIDTTLYDASGHEIPEGVRVFFRIPDQNINDLDAPAANAYASSFCRSRLMSAASRLLFSTVSGAAWIALTRLRTLTKT
jgi:hypothetical protein